MGFVDKLFNIQKNLTFGDDVLKDMLKSFEKHNININKINTETEQFGAIKDLWLNLQYFKTQIGAITLILVMFLFLLITQPEEEINYTIHSFKGMVALTTLISFLGVLHGIIIEKRFYALLKTIFDGGGG